MRKMTSPPTPGRAAGESRPTPSPRAGRRLSEADPVLAQAEGTEALVA
jgi:hypothetical protein